MEDVESASQTVAPLPLALDAGPPLEDEGEPSGIVKPVARAVPVKVLPPPPLVDEMEEFDKLLLQGEAPQESKQKPGMAAFAAPPAPPAPSAPLAPAEPTAPAAPASPPAPAASPAPPAADVARDRVETARAATSSKPLLQKVKQEHIEKVEVVCEQVLVDPYLETPVSDSALSVEVLSQPLPAKAAKQPIAKRRTRPASKKAIVKVPPPVPRFGATTPAGLPGAVPELPGPMLSQKERDRKLQEIKQLLEQQTSDLAPIPPPPLLTTAPPSTPLTPPTPLTPMTPATPMTPPTPTTPTTPMRPMTPMTPMTPVASSVPKDAAERRFAAYSQLLLGDDADDAEAPWKRQGKRRRADL
ncbi:unnamed protein product [Symbiodinium natans]|uniref:Uncharacterized protein n=1 Tax=Symbiodinium natans TaxID=878477 RepID=A0A812SBB0_9DINO|nr:unnamed protein product [Symbiodinium natans]